MRANSVVEVMSDPGLYGRDVDHVELRETHISWVFIAGERAYKVKKPVLMPFLDYRSLDARRHFCEEEVRLNRRLAPDVYLGVRALVAAGDGFVLGAAGDPDACEYAVEMRRLRDDRTLAASITAGRDVGEEIDRLGGRLAAFHAAAPPVERATPFYTQLDATLRSLVSASPPTARERLRLLARALRDLYDRCLPELDERVRRGLVRDGHGDLRAEHIVLEPPAIVDCVEFDPDLRRIDVGADIAFLAMDLEHLGAPHAAADFAAAYEAGGGDPGSERLQALFCAYRACVRSNIAQIRAAQLPGAEQAAARDEAHALERLAWRYVWRAQLPVVIVVCGAPAVGKSTLAREIAMLAGIERLSSDRVRKGLAGIGVSERAPESAYAEAATLAVYAELGRRAAANARGVVVDATFRRRASRDAFSAEMGPREPVFVACIAPSAVAAARARTRPAGESDAGPELAARLASEFEPLTEVPATRRLLLDTDESVETLAARVAAWLAACSRPRVNYVRPPRIAPDGDPVAHT